MYIISGPLDDPELVSQPAVIAEIRDFRESLFALCIVPLRRLV
jgi:hypothetical protein